MPDDPFDLDPVTGEASGYLKIPDIDGEAASAADAPVTGAPYMVGEFFAEAARVAPDGDDAAGLTPVPHRAAGYFEDSVRTAREKIVATPEGGDDRMLTPDDDAPSATPQHRLRRELVEEHRERWDEATDEERATFRERLAAARDELDDPTGQHDPPERGDVPEADGDGYTLKDTLVTPYQLKDDPDDVVIHAMESDPAGADPSKAGGSEVAMEDLHAIGDQPSDPRTAGWLDAASPYLAATDPDDGGPDGFSLPEVDDEVVVGFDGPTIGLASAVASDPDDGDAFDLADDDLDPLD